jgi:tripartite-type tricarboxylate transporter receptor subunit TctC
MRVRQQTIVATSLALVAATMTAHAAAQEARDLSTRPIRVVVPVPPGGSTDIVARIIAVGLADSAGLKIVVDNRPGAGGIIGAETVARAAPDGHTLLFAYASFTTTPFLSKVPYDPYRDFTPITAVAVTPLVLVINPSLPVANVKDLVALAKSRPNGLSAGIATAGSAGHLAMELFKLRTGTTQGIVSVIYSGGAPAQIALMSGEVQLVFGSVQTSLPFIKSGKVKAIASLAKKRLTNFPDTPTLGELGVQMDSAAPWQGILGPAKMPRAIVMRLYSEVAKVLKRPEIIERLVVTGAEPIGSTPDEFADKIKQDLQEFSKLIPTLGMKGGQ